MSGGVLWRFNIRSTMLSFALALAVTCVALWRAHPAAATTGSGRAPAVLTDASPVGLVFSPDGTRLYVLCQGNEEVRVLDAATFASVKNIPVGRMPRGLSLSHDGARLYVTNTWDDTLNVIETGALSVTPTSPVGFEPSGVVEGRDGKHN